MRRKTSETAVEAGANGSPEYQRNVLGTTLESCCSDVGGSGIATGFYRDGYCSTGSNDVGVHTVCAVVTKEFLQFSKRSGNDLITPRMPGFPGLKEGDRWCLCAGRWKEAYVNGKAPKVDLRASHEKSLQVVDLEILKQFSVEDIDEIDREMESVVRDRQALEKLAGEESDDF